MREVHIWSIALNGQVDSAYAAALSEDERARASRFYFERDARRYTIGRATLRRILSHYLGIEPAALSFTYNPFGKPALAAAQNPHALEFNLSNTGDHALCAVTYGCAVGIDIEAIKQLDYLQLAGTVFSAHEQATLQWLPAAEQPLGFFNGWTRKEAYIKAHGKGLSMPLADFDVTLSPNEPARLLATRPDATEAGRWSLFGWLVDEIHVAALAVAGQGWQLVQRESDELP
ncbi:MAG: 4'-phosphopantetheinyl transferase superfamily protein [Caldilineaceae bacterium]